METLEAWVNCRAGRHPFFMEIRQSIFSERHIILYKQYQKSFYVPQYLGSEYGFTWPCSKILQANALVGSQFDLQAHQCNLQDHLDQELRKGR